MGGFVGNILHVNLSTGKIEKEKIKESIARKLLGGPGYAVKLLLEELKPNVHPLSPQNVFIISTGPLTGTLCPGSDYWCACSKSPLTGCWGESKSGGGLGPELKFAGFDMITIRGASEKPVYLWVHDGEAEIRSAKHIYGSLIPEATYLLKEDVGDFKAKVACIGPAGENLVKFANIMTEINRAAGRCGMGAILGSKKLKGIVVRGHGEIPIADMEKFTSIIDEIEKIQAELPICGKGVFAFGGGTAAFAPFYDLIGNMPTKYGASNTWGKAGEFYELLSNKYFLSSVACFSCTMGCGKISYVQSGKWQTPPHHGPEYESLGVFTHLMMNDDLEAAIHMNYLCNIYGIDTVSCGNVISFYMECYERGWLKQAQINDLKLEWGNMEAVADIIKKIAKNEGVGKLLGEGVRALAQKIGREAMELALQVKGLETPMHDPRSSRTGKAWALAYGTSNRGGCHIHPHEPSILMGYYDKFGFTKADFPGIDEPYKEQGKAKIVIWAQNYGSAIEALGVCKFHSFTVPAFTPERYGALVSAATGWNIDSRELLRIGERIFNLQRLFNVYEGIRRKDDYPPKRLCEPPQFGPFSLRHETKIENYDAMLDEYYELRGWSRDGIPTQSKLKELEISEILAKNTT